MTCPDLLVLSQLIDGELPADEAAPLAAHLPTCARCTEQQARLERATALARRLVATHAEPTSGGAAPGSCLGPEDVAGWVERVLPPVAFEAAEAHLGRCDACLTEALAAAQTLAALEALSSLPVPESLLARMASRWQVKQTAPSLGGVVLRVARTAVELLERAVIAPLLDIEAGLVPAPAARENQASEALAFCIRAPRAEIRAMVVPQGDAVGLTLTFLGGDGAGLAGQRVFLRRHGRSLYSARTDADGALQMPRLEPGVYEVSCPGIDTAFRLDVRT